jgi:hypothetical protein
VGAAVLEVLIAPRTYSYPKVLLYVAAACAIVAVAESPSRGRLFLAALITAIAFLFRHDHGLYIGLATSAAVLFASFDAGWHSVGGRLALFAGAAALLVAPWLAFVSYQQGLINYFKSGLEFSRAEAERNRGPLSLPRFDIEPAQLMTLRPPFRPTAIVEWKSGTPETMRHSVEAEFGLVPLEPADNPPREYYGSPLSEARVRALATNPHVADVSGLDRFSQWSTRDAWLASIAPSRLDVGPGWHFDENAYVWLLYVFYLVPIACGLTAWRLARAHVARWPGEPAVIAALVVLALLVNVGLLRGNLAVWLPDGIAPAAILGAWLVPFGWNARPRVALRIIAAILVAITVGAVALAGDLHAQVDRSEVRSGLTGLHARYTDLQSRLWGTHRDARMPPSSVSEALSPFFGYVNRCTRPDDRLVMAQVYPDVFVLAERGFAGGQLAFLEGFYTSPADQRLTLSRMQRESVPFVLLMRNREDVFRANFDLISQYIDGRYRPMADVPVEGTDAVRLFVDTQRSSSGIDHETGWPCLK